MGCSWAHPVPHFHRCFHFPPSDLNHRGSSSLQLLLWGLRPEMKEEPRTGLGLFKFFGVGFGEGGHVNFIGVGQDLGLKCEFACFWLHLWSVLPWPRGHVAVCGREGGSLHGCHCIGGRGGRVFANILSHLGNLEKLPVWCLQ